jgi:hypothetical protein
MTIVRLRKLSRRCLRTRSRASWTRDHPATLFVSEGTAKTHVARILAKLDLRDRTQAVIYAYENGVVEPRQT